MYKRQSLHLLLDSLSISFQGSIYINQEADKPKSALVNTFEKSIFQEVSQEFPKFKILYDYQQLINWAKTTKIENLNDGLRKADILSLSLPLNKDTHNLISLKEMKLMSKNSIIINLLFIEYYVLD